MNTPRLTSRQALDQAWALHQSGHLREAEQLYRAVLQVKADDSEANHNLGALLLAVGNAAQAKPLLLKAVTVAPLVARYWLSYQEALLRSGEFEAARGLAQTVRQRGLGAGMASQLESHFTQLRQQASGATAQVRANRRQATAALAMGTTGSALADRTLLEQLLAQFQRGEFERVATEARDLAQRFPADGRVWKFLSGALFHLGRKEELVESARRTAELLPGDAENHNNLAAALKDVERFDEAEACAQRAVKTDPNHAESHANLASILIDLRRYAEAEASAARAVRLKPALLAGQNNLGLARVFLGTATAALEPLQAAIRLAPDSADAHCNLGHAHLALRQQREAIASFRRASELRPDFVDALVGLGDAEHESFQFEAAETHYGEALALARERSEKWLRALYGKGKSIFAQGHMAEAVPLLEQAVDSNLLAAEYALGARLLLPAIPASVADIDHWRARFVAGIESFAASDARLSNPLTLSLNTFYLAYHDRDDRAVMELLARTLRVSAPVLTGISAPRWTPPRQQQRRIRVGILSGLLHGHTIGKLFGGMIFNLDRSRFELIVIRTSDAKSDVTSKGIDAMAGKVVHLALKDLRAQQEAIAAEKLDVLFYPDIGMNYTYYLAYARLAPVQVVCWGHPDTTGLDTVDYFLSADSIEASGAEEHYTERLIRLNRLPSFYVPFAAPAEVPVREILGLPAIGNLYGCPQSTFKLHPDFDPILQQIVDEDPDGHIVMLEGLTDPWKRLLIERWKRTAPRLPERVKFLPMRPLEGFMALMAHFDVVLDPIHFGSGNTLYEAMAYGTPIVTWPGRFMRGRIVAGAYAQMGIEDPPVARTLDEYAPLAVALGRDPARRQALRRRLLEASGPQLFGDELAVREIEQFFEAAVEAAAAGTKLPAGWRPQRIAPTLGGAWQRIDQT